MKKIIFIIFSLLICGCSSTNNVEEKNHVYNDGTLDDVVKKITDIIKTV